MVVGFLIATGPSALRNPLRKTQSVCTRPLIRASASDKNGESWKSATNYESIGKGVKAKGLQRLEFKIHQDGRVEELVTGIKGSDCVELTKKIEEALGTVINTEQTEEYFEKEYVQNVESNVNREFTTNGEGGEIPTW